MYFLHFIKKNVDKLFFTKYKVSHCDQCILKKPPNQTAKSQGVDPIDLFRPRQVEHGLGLKTSHPDARFAMLFDQQKPPGIPGIQKARRMHIDVGPQLVTPFHETRIKNMTSEFRQPFR